MAKLSYEEILSNGSCSEFPISDEFSSYKNLKLKNHQSSNSRKEQWTVHVSTFVKQEGEEKIPSARTYHASTLVEKYMVVVGGESGSSDLNDFWALDLESK